MCGLLAPSKQMQKELVAEDIPGVLRAVLELQEDHQVREAQGESEMREHTRCVLTTPEY